MKKYQYKIILISILALLLSACGSPAVSPLPTPTELPQSVPADPAQLLEFTDDLGRTIILDSYPQRIVSMAPSITEILFEIGAGDLLVGRDDFSVYPEAVAEIPSFGSLFADFPAEAILAMEPDLVIAAEIISQESVQALEELGLNVYWQANPVTFDELFDNVAEIAGLVGQPNTAEDLIQNLSSRVAVVQSAVAGIEAPPLVFYELDATDPSNPWTSGAGTFIDTVISEAGGVNLGAALEGDYVQISSEALIDQNPEFIILGDSDYGVTPEIVAARGGWGEIAAVLNDQVFPIGANLLSVPGPRMVDGLEYVAGLLHPDLFD